ARRRRGTLTFEAYDRTMEALVRMISQVTAITRSLDLQHPDENQEEESPPDRADAPSARASRRPADEHPAAHVAHARRTHALRGVRSARVEGVRPLALRAP
ncbi:hypothetical protein CLM84_11965, partial [Streptomyces albidoflavus]